MDLRLALVLLMAAALAPPGAAPVDTTWPQFRGPAGRGVSAIESLPTIWSATKNVAWKASVPGRGWSSPIVWGDQVIVTSALPGAFKAKTGREIYKARVGGVGHTFSASPWAYGGKVFCLSEEGDTFVLDPGDKYDEVAKNSLGEMTLATPAVTRDGLFVRTATALYRIR